MANINKNIIMQAGAAVANAANKAAGLPVATPEPGSIISVIQLVNGGRTIGPDALAHFTESVRNKLLSLLVNLEPIQDFNGFDHPWPAGGGKNKLPSANSISSPASLTVTNEDGQYVLNGSIKDGDSIYFRYDTITIENGFVFACGNSFVNAILYFLNGTTQVDYVTLSPVNRVINTSQMSTLYGKPFDTIRIRFSKDQTFTNAIFSPMVVIDGADTTTFAPYSNICPFSGRTGLHVYAGPTSAIGDAATYSMAWTSPAGTVYAGSADIVSGDIKVAPYYASYNGETLVGPWVSSMDVYDPEGTPTTGAQVADLGGTMTEYHITGQDIITLVGDNYIWSDSGDVTIKE